MDLFLSLLSGALEGLLTGALAGFFISLSQVIRKSRYLARIERDGVWATMFVRDLKEWSDDEATYNVDVCIEAGAAPGVYQNQYFFSEFKLENAKEHMYDFCPGHCYYVLADPRESKIFYKDTAERELSNWKTKFLIFCVIDGTLLFITISSIAVCCMV